MPSMPCKHPTCTAYVQRPARYCQAHIVQAKAERSDRDRFYDQHGRDPVAKAFYNSAAWKRVRREVLAEHPVCQRCEREWSQHVHHKKKLKDCTPDEALDKQNLKAVCQPCHNEEEAEVAAR
jgi:5-methylcytosine-specific restriction protein A